MSQIVSLRNRVSEAARSPFFLFAFLCAAAVSTCGSPLANRDVCRELTWDQVLERGQRRSDEDRVCLVNFLRNANREKWETRLAQVLLEEWDAISSPELGTPRLLDDTKLPKGGERRGWVYFHVAVDSNGIPVSGCIDGEFESQEDLKVLGALLESRYRPAQSGKKFVPGTFTLVFMRCR